MPIKLFASYSLIACKLPWPSTACHSINFT